MILFTAPRDFDPALELEYAKLGNVAWDNHCANNITEWVCDPSADFTIDTEVLDHYPNLRILATPSTGNNHIDLDAVRARGIKFLSLLDDREGLETISASAEFTFKLLLDALRKEPARELRAKAIRMIGFGRIGHRLSLFCEAGGAYWYAFDPYLRRDDNWRNSFKNIFLDCDVVVICCTYNKETHSMIKKEHILSMKQGAALVNTARGEIIDEQGLYEALAERPDIRFATDVVHGEVEGRGEESRTKLRALGAIVTPHIAGATYDSRTKAARIILDLLKKEI